MMKRPSSQRFVPFDFVSWMPNADGRCGDEDEVASEGIGPIQIVGMVDGGSRTERTFQMSRAAVEI
jgi:hypothetical protein